MTEGPRYQQIADDLRTEIAAGDWQLGDRLPRLSELAAQWQVSTSTIRDAQQVLAHEGLLHAVHGRGVFVVAREPSTVDPLISLRHAAACLDQAMQVMAQQATPAKVGEFTRGDLALIRRALEGHARRLRVNAGTDWRTGDPSAEAEEAEQLANRIREDHA